MFDRLMKLPGNLLRDVVGILPHDEAGNPQYDQWCKNAGGTMVNGTCQFGVSSDQYNDLHSSAFGSAGTETAPTGNEFAKAYDHYLLGKQQE